MNIFQGKFLDGIIDFVRKNDIDILNFQEVTGGSLSKGGGYNYQNFEVEKSEIARKSIGIDCRSEIEKSLLRKSVFVKTMNEREDQNSYYGNGVFFKPTFTRIYSKSVFLAPYLEVDRKFNRWEKLGRAALFTKFEADGKSFWVINAHLAWGETPYDKDYKIKQAEKLFREIEKLGEPFILAGDFNVVQTTKTASMFDELGRNLSREFGLKNTLNPRTHPVKHLFPPGLAVDYIFVSDKISVKNFRLVDEIDLSDHFGLLLEFEA